MPWIHPSGTNCNESQTNLSWVSRHGEEPRLPGLQDYTPKQMFWIRCQPHLEKSFLTVATCPAPPTRGAQSIGTSLWRRGSRPAHTVQGCSAFRWLQNKFSCLAEQAAIITFNFQGPFSNSPDFARDFVCPLGSAMNPVKKCEVW